MNEMFALVRKDEAEIKLNEKLEIDSIIENKSRAIKEYPRFSLFILFF